MTRGNSSAISQSGFRDEELLADTIADLIGDVRHVAIGNASPIPATAALLARERGHGRPYVSLLGSRRHTFFTDGGRELFDCAGQGRIDVFFLSGGADRRRGQRQPGQHRRLRAPEGALPRLVRLGLSLFRRAEGDPVPHRAHAPHAGREGRLHQRAGTSADNVYRPGGPIALITNRCLFAFDRERRRFRLESVHPGHTLAEVEEHTGFEFDRPADVPVTPAPSAETLRLMRKVVAPQLVEVYPQFAAECSESRPHRPNQPAPAVGRPDHLDRLRRPSRHGLYAARSSKNKEGRRA